MKLNEFLENEEQDRDERLKNGISTIKYILTFQESDLTIQIHLKSSPIDNFEEVDLEQCVDAASLLEDICRLHGKKWDGDNEVIHAFLTLFNDVLEKRFTDSCSADDLAQGVTLDWATKTAIYPTN